MDDSYDSDSDSSLSDLGFDMVMGSVNLNINNVENSLDRIIEAFKNFESMLIEQTEEDNILRILVSQLEANMLEEKDNVTDQLHQCLDALDRAQSMVHPDQNRIAQLEAELKGVQQDNYVILSRLDQNEGQGGLVASKAQKQRDENESSRPARIEQNRGTRHNRAFSLLDIYDKMKEDSSEENSEEEEDDNFIEQKLTVTMQSRHAIQSDSATAS